MLFMIYCVDKPNHGEVRAANRPDHLDYLKAQGDKLVAAGPTPSDDGSAVTGSLIIMEMADRAAAEAFAAADPYAQAGLFESVTIKPWKKVLPAAG
ncbi:MAG: YciI family protein [Pseudomonadota bacterium]